MINTKHMPLLFLMALISACSQAGTAPTDTLAGPRTLSVMTHDSFAVSEDIIAEFESANNVKVQFLKAGDTGTALNKARRVLRGG
jgi:thiamine transport system substrate-binding protein